MSERKTILIFKKLALTTLSLYLFLFLYFLVLKGLLPGLDMKISVLAAAGLFMAIISFGWLLLTLIYLYKSSKILQSSGHLEVNPGLIIILGILGVVFTGIYPVITLIVVICILSKSNAYLKNT